MSSSSNSRSSVVTRADPQAPPQGTRRRSHLRRLNRSNDQKCHSSRRSKSCATSWRYTKSMRTSRKNLTRSLVKRLRMCAYQISENKNAIRQSQSKRQLYNCQTSFTQKPPLHSLHQASSRSSTHNYAKSNRSIRSTMSKGAQSIALRVTSSKAYTLFRILRLSSFRLWKPRKRFWRRSILNHPSCQKSLRITVNRRRRTTHAGHPLGTSMASKRRRRSRVYRHHPK